MSNIGTYKSDLELLSTNFPLFILMPLIRSLYLSWPLSSIGLLVLRYMLNTILIRYVFLFLILGMTRIISPSRPSFSAMILKPWSGSSSRAVFRSTWYEGQIITLRNSRHLNANFYLDYRKPTRRSIPTSSSSALTCPPWTWASTTRELDSTPRARKSHGGTTIPASSSSGCPTTPRRGSTPPRGRRPVGMPNQVRCHDVK